MLFTFKYISFSQCLSIFSTIKFYAKNNELFHHAFALSAYFFHWSCSLLCFYSQWHHFVKHYLSIHFALLKSAAKDFINAVVALTDILYFWAVWIVFFVINNNLYTHNLWNLDQFHWNPLVQHRFHQYQFLKYCFWSWKVAIHLIKSKFYMQDT